MALSWPKMTPLQLRLQVHELLALVERHRLRRNARHLRDDGLHVVQRHLAGARRAQAIDRAGLVDDVDGLVGQELLVDVLGRQLHRRADGVGVVLHLVVLLVRGVFRPLRIFTVSSTEGSVMSIFWKRREQRAVALDARLVLLVRGRADAAQLARGERRLEQVRRVHRAAAGRAGADDGVDLVDEEHRVLVAASAFKHRLEPLLELAAELGAGEQRAHVEREDPRLASASGTFFCTMASASPSAMAVLPTPDSPT